MWTCRVLENTMLFIRLLVQISVPGLVVKYFNMIYGGILIYLYAGDNILCFV